MTGFREGIRLLHQAGVAGEMAGADQADHAQLRSPK
jgi:hypothetical protein